MKASTKRALSLLLAAALVVASLFVYATLIRGEYENVARLRGEYASKSAFLEEQGAIITQAQDLIARYKGAERLGGQLSLALPKNESVSSIMAQVNFLARTNALSIQSVNISYLPIKPSLVKLSSAKGLGTLRLDLKLFGSYASLKRFLNNLETNVRISDVQSLKIEPAGQPNQDLYVYSLTADVYYQP
ncbi:MAG: hypothetical protein A3I89_00010 [Candidatus Harrisonbacteria bacterium RIFCSPLOWO2_02_FULL_41_11]|uniref:Type 4 fimbrial biogenesis protein PilO n=1 Tax=Candidatus Harrisonbacteria bacterium RIFCSPHIGHO2_02_FULL_42_16 TaxID=1798404 RepID=A0A1G1ZFY7_9BACT|nr:MAG: hypothetical protein A3B92_01390 [Candidatus Harrisonbacteria bacterium RIFCSPHIGHO2_02_FULL_42_16]OGY63427.1 MAG: hypothetical protein A3B92_01400 [Candidatus Harrisonbacteria bacterium RIFCSPHIGHO2_02_FULL_42_16]OGY66796.1 MAG: hypothetical protein A3I89_00010 [Candidatus Harrisonbacteria bacterium RIFCSPLOWO2_02_FULL_41_11]